MSTISCDACDTLRQQAPEFVQNGVTDNVAASLKNNTGLNPALTVLHDNCTDLNNVNDCLIGRMGDEIKAYDNCDWKEFMGKFTPNLYETLKAIIMSDCGEWSKLDLLCNGIDELFKLVRGSGAKAHLMTPTAVWREKFYAWFNSAGGRIDASEYYFPSLQADIRGGIGCKTNAQTFARRTVTGWSRYAEYPYGAGSGVNGLSAGDIVGYINKAELVPHDMPESIWISLMRGYLTEHWISIDLNFRVWARLRGYIVIEGVVFNEDLRGEYGEDVMVLEVVNVEDSHDTGGIWGPYIPLQISEL